MDKKHICLCCGHYVKHEPKDCPDRIQLSLTPEEITGQINPMLDTDK